MNREIISSWSFILINIYIHAHYLGMLMISIIAKLMYNLKFHLNDVGYLGRKDSNLLYILKIPCTI
jgi:hypothetical protein